jgi:hypothetical protein
VEKIDFLEYVPLTGLEDEVQCEDRVQMLAIIIDDLHWYRLLFFVEDCVSFP